MRSWSLAGLLAGSLLMAVSCSGDDDDASAPSITGLAATTTAAPTTTPSTTLAPSTTVEPTTTTVDPTTTTPEPTAPSTSAAPPTTSMPDGVPPRVTFPDDPEKQAVVDAVYAFFDAGRAAQAAPADPVLRRSVANTMVDPIATRMAGFLDRLVEADERIVGNPDQPSYLDVIAPSVSAIDGSGIVDACAVDGDLRLRGREADVVDDDLASGLQTYSLIFDGTGWRVQDFTTSARFEGQAGCG